MTAFLKVLSLCLCLLATPAFAASPPQLEGAERFASKGKWEILRLAEGCAALYHFTPAAELWIWGAAPNAMTAAVAVPSGTLVEAGSDAGSHYKIVLEGTRFEGVNALGTVGKFDLLALEATPAFFEKFTVTRMLKFIEDGNLRTGMQLYQQLGALDELGACLAG